MHWNQLWERTALVVSITIARGISSFAMSWTCIILRCAARVTMKTIELSPGCEKWKQGDSTKHPPFDANFLAALTEAGFLAFIGPGGLCGGKSDSRTVLAIHRGRGTRWEVVFRDNDSDIVSTMTTDLPGMTMTMLAWLSGKSLTAEENSLHAIAG